MFTLIAFSVKRQAFTIENAVPIDVRILFFGRGSAKSFARCMIIAAKHSTSEPETINTIE